MNVLPNSKGRSFPRPIDGRFDDGQYSAVAGNMKGGDPSVLRDFQHFEVKNAKFLPGSFSAVGVDQMVMYNGGGGGKRDENAEKLLMQDG